MSTESHNATVTRLLQRQILPIDRDTDVFPLYVDLEEPKLDTDRFEVGGNAAAKAALTNGQIDALVLDLPTAFEVQAEMTDGVIVGQLPAGGEKAEQFGIVLDKDSPLTACVSKAIDELGSDGELFKLQKVWLTGAGNAPVLS